MNPDNSMQMINDKSFNTAKLITNRIPRKKQLKESYKVQ